MEWKTILFVLKILLHFARGQVDENEFYAETECCRKEEISEGECNFKEEDCIQPIWDTVNTTNGRFRMKFDVPNGNNCRKYKAKLYFLQSITNAAECKGEEIFEKDRLHTIGKTLEVKEWNETCTKAYNETAGEFYFQFIFTGCYWLEITVEEPIYSTISLCPTYLISDYRKQSLLVSKTTTGVEAEDSSTELSTIIRFNMSDLPWRELWLVQSKLTVTAKLEENRINQWEVWLQPDKRVSCNQTKYTKELPKCELVSSNSLELRFSNDKPGEYKYTISLDDNMDNRCKTATLWTSKTACEWPINQTVQSKTSTKNPEQETENSYVNIYGPILFGVFLVLIFTFVAIRYTMKRNPLTVPVQAPINVSILGQRTAIFLLYSRDCDAFMKLMVSFRQLLEQATEFEIYDCYDPKRWAEISLDPSSWMQRLITHQDTRVIAVASRCASLRQRAHIDGATIHFAAPLNTDKMFPYALRLLTDEMARIASYERAFVVRFDGFSGDKDLYQVLNSYTRFVLPLHLEKLICNLKQSKVDEITESWSNFEEGKILKDNLDGLVQYKNQNPNYLQSLLVKERTGYEPEISWTVYT